MGFLLKRLSILFLFSLFIGCSPDTKADHFIIDPNDSADYSSDSVEIDLGKVDSAWGEKGEYCIVLDSSSKYGLVIDFLDVRGGDVFEATVRRWEHHPLVTLVADGRWDGHFVQSGWGKRTADGWEQIRLYVEVPAGIDHTQIRFYTFNPTGKPCHVNRLRIKRYLHGARPDLPEEVLLPFLYSVLQHYHLLHYSPLPIDSMSKYIASDEAKGLLTRSGLALQTVLSALERLANRLSSTEINERLHQMRQSLQFATVRFQKVPEMNPPALSGYIAHMFCTPMDTAKLILLGDIPCVSLDLYQLQLPDRAMPIRRYRVGGDSIFLLPCDGLKPGIYRIRLNGKRSVTYDLPLIIRDTAPAPVAILVPYTTWYAYNSFGGKSLYKNGIDRSDVYFVSTERPLNSISFGNVFEEGNLYSLLHVYQWFNSNFGATLLPDYWLEAHPEELEEVELAVLFAHCEYFSTGMFHTLDSFAQCKKLLSLGGNQMYWKIRWDRDYTRIECRKDGNYFEGSNIPGGKWCNPHTSEARVLGVAFTSKGYGTYGPYRVVRTSHPLFKGMSVYKGMTFGKEGIDHRGICGDEMDVVGPGSPPETQILARGQRGGDMVFIRRKNGGLTLSCGAISAGAGLGADSIFTGVIRNFVRMK